MKRRDEGASPGLLARACFAAALRAFPPSSRARFGEGMRETFADRWTERRRSVPSRLVLLLACTADVVRAGVLERARVRALRRHHSIPKRKGKPMQSLWSDVRFALRGLRRSPVFAAIAVVTLALGIGATTTIFSVLEAVLLRPWPLPEASRLVVASTIRPATGERWGSVNYADYEDWKEAGVFENVALFQRLSADMAAPGGDPERVRGMVVTRDFFATLRVRAALGRLPTSEEYDVDAARVVVLSNGLWRSRFAADRAVLGTAIRLAGSEATVIGVLPAEADVLDAALFAPIQQTAESLEIARDRDNFAYSGIARMHADDIDASRTALQAVAARIARENAALREGTSSDITPLARWVVGDELARILWVALGAVGLVLLIGCANLANLLLARGMRRERELAVRSALGAGRRRLVGQLLVESLVLALVGGAAGVLLSKLAIDVLVARAPADVPRLGDIGIDVAVLGFALALTLASALVFGLLPAFRSTAVAGGRALADRGAGDGGVRGRRWRAALVVAEVALTVILLAGAGLMLRSLQGLMRVDPGFDTTNLLAFNLSLRSADRYPDRAAVLASHARLRDRLAAVPGVDGIAETSQLPLGAGPGYLTRAFLPEGGAEPPNGPEIAAPWEIVTPGYFGVMRQTIRGGRDFTTADDGDGTPVMIVNHEFARRMFGDDASALGKRVRSWRDENVYRTVVGVVDDVRYFGAGDEIRPVVYIPLPQDVRRGLAIVVRTAADATSLIPVLRAAVRDFDADLATADFTTMRAAFDASVAGRRFAASLLSTFALLALLLAAVGLYGVLSIAVAQRTREFGVRMALGAAATDVRRMVLRQAGALVAIGAVLGIAAAFGITRVLSAVLFGVGAHDPLTFASVVGLLLVIGLFASWLPAARATRVDPMRAMRAE